MEEDFTPGSQYDDNNIICPYCGHSYQIEGEDVSESEREEECEECYKVFIRWSQFNVTHYTIKKNNYDK